MQGAAVGTTQLFSEAAIARKVKAPAGDGSICSEHKGRSCILHSKREPNLIDQHVGNRVRLQRLIMGWSQSKLGDAPGVSFQQVQKCESGTNRIGASRLQNVAEILKVPVAFFFEGLRRYSVIENYSQVIPTSDGLSLANAFMKIREPTIRRRLIALIEQIGNSQQATLS
jgi:transcriptional regulator with XRE-family HTH domain